MTSISLGQPPSSRFSQWLSVRKDTARIPDIIAHRSMTPAVGHWLFQPLEIRFLAIGDNLDAWPLRNRPSVIDMSRAFCEYEKAEEVILEIRPCLSTQQRVAHIVFHGTRMAARVVQEVEEGPLYPGCCRNGFMGWSKQPDSELQPGQTVRFVDCGISFEVHTSLDP